MEYRLFMMRHFATFENDNDIYMGQLDYSVNPARMNLKAGGFVGIDCCHLISSPLKRAVESAYYVMNRFSLIKWEFETNDLLKERCLGEFEGKKKSAIKSGKSGDKYFFNNQLILQETPPGAEGIDSFCARVNSFKKYLDKCLASNNVLLVTHVQVMRALLCDNISNDKWYSMFFSHGEIIEV